MSWGSATLLLRRTQERGQLIVALSLGAAGGIGAGDGAEGGARSTGPAVEEVRHFRIAFRRAVPVHTRGLAAGVEELALLRGDVGVLESDPNGVRTVSRLYWSNRAHVVMGDLPAEA